MTYWKKSLVNRSVHSIFKLSNKNFFWFEWGPFIWYVRKISEKLTFLTPWYVHVSVHIEGKEIIVFWKIFVLNEWPRTIRIILKACLQILILRKIKYKFVLAVSFVEIEERKGKNERLQNMFSESIRRVHLL